MSMLDPRELVSTRNLLPVVLCITLAAIIGAVGAMLDASVFERFLGPLHPALAIGVATLLALPALAFLDRRYGFRILVSGSSRRGVASAGGLAALFAVGAIAADLGLRYPEAINVPLPYGLFVYPVMALIVEFLFHVSLLALLLFLLRPVAAKTDETGTVWIAIILTALAEPILQVVWAGSVSWTELYTAISIFLFGVVQLSLFRRHGFLPMLSMRLVYYLLWHIAWGYVRLELLF